MSVNAMKRCELRSFIFCAVFVTVQCTQLYLDIGDLCPLENKNLTGVCLHLENCSSARAQVKLKQHPVLCSFQGLYPIVCCEIDNAVTVEGNDTSVLLKGQLCFLQNNEIGVCTVSTECSTTSNNTLIEFSNCKKDLICCPEEQLFLPKINLIQLVTIKKPLHRQKCNTYRREFFKYQYNTEPIESLEYIGIEEVDFEEELPIINRELKKREIKHETRHILGGELALLYEFPHMAAIGFGNETNKVWLCGGTLISENFVLTAAHCLFSEEGDAKYVRLGSLDIRNRQVNPDRADFNIIETIKHPEFKPPLMYNDIALLKLDRNVTFSKAILPACLHDNFTIPVTNLTATGWGHTEYGGNESNELLKVVLNSTSFEYCKAQYKIELTKRILNRGIDDETQFCYGGDGTEKDTCQGDSGGPLQMKYAGMYRIVGVTSFGKACGIGKTPGVYTRVSSYVPWIESIVWK